MENKFYVYEHIRPDTGKVCYVGKGHGSRAWDMRQRRAHHKNIQAKLARDGLEMRVRIVRDCLPERCAFVLERIVIALHREKGAKLCNLTDGGEGPAGYRHTEEWKAENSRRMKGRPRDPRASEKTAEKLRGRPLSEEHKRKLSESHKGYAPTDTQRENLSKALKGRFFSEEHRRKISEAKRGRPGHKASEETKARMSASQTGRKMSPQAVEKAKETKRRNGKRWTIPSKRVAVVCDSTGMEFSAMKEAADFYGCNPSAICRVCKGERTHYKGLVFSYKEQRSG